MDQQIVRDVVEQAARAPSIHNTQPWRFVAGADVIELWTDPSRGLAVADPSGRARHLSCGAALLHARIAAAGAGYAAHVSELPDPGHPDHLADIRLDSAAEPTPDDRELAGAISTRRTTRTPFTDAAVPDEVVASLRVAVEAEGCWLRLVETTEDAAAVAVLLARADEVETADPAYREELRRWTTGDSDGVPATAVPDAPPSERGSNYRLRDFVADREPAGTAARAEDPPPVERPLVVVLGTPEDDVLSWLAAGQGLARLLLTATSRGVSASPITQALEIPDTRRRLATELGVVGHPQMILRLGYSADDGTAAGTPRRPVEEILGEEGAP
jgi:nitroreductase